MFYCDECAKDNKWQNSFVKSFGLCEMCGRRRICNDVPSSKLPLPKGKKSMPASTLARGNDIETDFFELKAQEFGPLATKAEIQQAVEAALSNLMKERRPPSWPEAADQTTTLASSCEATTTRREP